MVFPEAPKVSLSCDTGRAFCNCDVAPRERSGVGCDVLSTGAREQLAAALRVTMAEVLAEAYDGNLPVLVDGVFANSDPERKAGV